MLQGPGGLGEVNLHLGERKGVFLKGVLIVILLFIVIIDSKIREN